MPNISWVKDFAAKLVQAVEVIESAGKAKTEVSALKAEIDRLNKDRDKLVDSLKKQADVEAKAMADDLIAMAKVQAKDIVDTAQKKAADHFQFVKKDADAYAKRMAAEAEQHAAKAAEAEGQAKAMRKLIEDMKHRKDAVMAELRELVGAD